MTEVVTPGETATPPVAPAAPAAPADPSGQPAPQPTPTGSEPENNPGGQPDSEMVPSGRLREETEKRRQAEDRVAELEAAADQPPTPPANSDDEEELDSETEKLLDNYAKKRGLVSQSELDSRAMQQQVKQDIDSLIASPPVSGIPYDDKAVMDHAKANNLPITSKNALIAAYRDLNWDKIVEAERQRAIDGFKSGGGSGAEKPGASGGAKPPAEPEITGKSPKERAKERIRLARQKLQT